MACKFHALMTSTLFRSLPGRAALLGAACTALLALLLDGLVTMASRLWLERGLRPS